MTYMLTHVFLSVTPIEYSLAYAASNRHNREGTKTKGQDVRVTLEEITIEVISANNSS